MGATVDAGLFARGLHISKGGELCAVTFGGANSLDNYLARPDHEVDWLRWGDEAAAVMASFWKTIDTVLMGRRTFEVAVRKGQGRGYRE